MKGRCQIARGDECIREGFIYEYEEWTDHLVYYINAK